MSKRAKLLAAVKQNPAGVSFSDLCRLVSALGFELKRQGGSHHVYTKAGVEEIINLQPNGSAAKTYQVRQVLDLIEKYNLTVE